MGKSCAGRCVVGLFLLAWVVRIAAEEPADAEHIRLLVRHLSDESFEVREAATAELHRIGEPAWPFLEPCLEDKDHELALRVSLLARDIASVPEAQRARVRDLLCQLETTDDELKRAEALDRLLEQGPGALRLVRRLLSGKESRPAIDLRPERRVFTAGQAVTGSAVLKNEGTATFWIQIQGLAFRWRLDTAPEPFGERRPTKGRRLMVKRTSGNPARPFGYLNPIHEWRAVAGGTVAVEQKIEQVLPSPGVYLLSAYITGGVPQATIEPWIPFAGDTAPAGTPSRQTLEGGNEDSREEVNGVWYKRFAMRDGSSVLKREPFSPKTIPLGINAALSQKDRTPIREEQVFALPDFPAMAGGTLAHLEFVTKAPLQGVAGSRQAWELSLVSRLKEQRLELEAGLERFAWYALLDAEGLPAQWGSWHSILADQDSFEEKGRILTPGGRVTWKLALDLPEKPGEYTLVAGYTVPKRETTNPTEENAVFDATAGSADTQPLAETALAARLGRVRVEPKR